jgi:hypothetical protein
LSGTLIETVAWHCPWFLRLVRDLRVKRLLTLIGGTYAENVMPLFSPAFNLRHLNEHLRLYRRHLECPPGEVQICWVPERVWDTARLAPVLTSGRLANGGYGFVLLDDRLLYPTGGSYPGSRRALFDAAGPFPSTGPYAAPAPPASGQAGGLGLVEAGRPYRIAGTNGLVVLPISAGLRYWVPPAFPDHWRRLEETVGTLREEGGEIALLLYADDMEKPAGVGPWETNALARYEAFLGWVASRSDVASIRLPDWLAGRPWHDERQLEAGTYFELAQGWQAGEDYRRWWGGAAWLPYRRYLATAQFALRAARWEGADRRLLALAWKHLLASTYETAWHWPGAGAEGAAPAPWAKGLASHARACLVMAAAALWFAQRKRRPAAEVVDIDQDGAEEVILRNEYLYAVLAPGCGGRLVYLFARTPSGGALMLGNPSDDWNWQEELNRYMDRPPNHPGGLADVGFEHDHYRVSLFGGTAAHAFVEMTNVQEGSQLFGARKSLLLTADAPALVVCYRVPERLNHLATEACLSPDYYRLLREGRRQLILCQGETWQGARNREVAVWLGLAGDEITGWAQPAQLEVGHGLNVRLQARSPYFHVLIGCGDTDEDRCQWLIQKGRDALRGIRTGVSSAAVGGT